MSKVHARGNQTDKKGNHNYSIKIDWYRQTDNSLMRNSRPVVNQSSNMT